MLHGGLHVVFEQANAMSAATAAGRLLKKLIYRYGSKYRSLRRNEAVQFSGLDRHFVGVSEKVADDMRRVYPAASDRVHVIRLGIDGGRFDPGLVGAQRARARERLRISQTDRVALFISNNYRLKGLWDLIDALPLARRSEPSLKLLVVGRDKTLRYRIWARLRGVADHILFVGPVKDAFEIYAAADALIHPTYYDACATVCLEAMACGLPVATSIRNGACEFLNDGAGGVLFDMPTSRSELARSLVELFRDEVRETARMKNSEIIRGWTPERSFQSVLLLYESILDARGSKA
jgi:UDP-glucose:(heptosyl)LPS alpha-1,3-glucosyltransferase